MRDLQHPSSPRTLNYGKPSWHRSGLLIASWKLVTPDSCRPGTNHFGMGKAIPLGIIIVEVCEAIHILVYPWGVAIRNIPEIIAGFQRMGGFLNCAGAATDTHVPIVDCQKREVSM